MRVKLRQDANGNLLSAGGRSYAWTSFNKPRLISLGAESSSFDYDASRERVFELQNRVLNGAQQVTEIFTAGGYERRINADGSTEDRVYVTAGGLPVALLTRAGVETATPDGGAGATIRYLHTDHQGSVEAVSGFIDGVFRIVDRMSYDPYGARRLPNGTADTSHSEEKRAHPADRGYTGHHQLDHLQLIHMNGRVYDPYLGRFISADPFIQDPYSSQSLNRYSYVWNNPVNGTDPSGYFLKGLYRGGKNFLQDNRRLIYSVAITAAGGWVVAPLAGASLVAGSAYVGFTAGLVGSGGDLKAAAIGGITAGAFAGVGNVYAQNPGGLLGGGHTGMLVEKTIAHGVVGGTSSVLAGGKFGAGFLSAAVPAGYRNAGFGGQLGSLRGYAEAAILGGTASELGGGKFANGAITATMAYAFNDLATHHAKAASQTATIRVQRTISTENSTVGELSIDGTSIKGYVLEPAGPSSGIEGSDRRIAAGEYAFTPYSSSKFPDTYQVQGVEGRTLILMHPGNFPADTAGCFLPGTSYGTDRVNNSGMMMNQVRSQIGSGSARIIISD